MHKNRLNIPKKIFLFNEEIKGVDFVKIKKFVKDFFCDIPLNLIKVKDIVQTKGIVFDFLKTKQNFEELGYPQEKNTLFIILTDKLFATYEQDNRLHIRAAIFSLPCIISIPGIVEGPAKPREYYILKKRYTALGIWELKEQDVKKKFKGKFIDYKDKRLTEVIKGYVAQAIFFFMTGNPFCTKKTCRLYNAHWQKDLISSQIKSGEFCAGHMRVLERIRKILIYD